MADFVAGLQRRRKALILVFTASVLVAVAALQAFDLWSRRNQTLRYAHARADNLAFILAEYVRGSFALADTSLRQLGIHARRVGGPTAPAEEWKPMLLAARSALPNSGAITITDAAGVVRHSTHSAILGHSRADEYIFKQLAASLDDDLVVSTPFLTPVEPRRYVLPIGRKVVDSEGRFDGTIVATLVPETYRQYFQTVNVGAEGVIWVVHSAGVLLFREPSETDPFGRPAAGNAIFEALRNGKTNGTLAGRVEEGGAAFVSAFRSVGTPPLTVAVSLSEAELLVGWRHQRRTAALAFAALTLTLMSMLSVLFRQMNARDKVETELRELQRLEAEHLREANERLEKALQGEQKARQESEAASYLKDEFLMSVSHELRTPLTAIYGWVRMLANDQVRPDQRRKALEAVERNARAQTRLIDDLLDVSRAITGKLRIESRPVNVAKIVAEAVETLKPALDAKSIDFEQHIDPGMDPVFADADRLQQLVWNLLSNAIKFTPERGNVALTVSRHGAAIEIVVSDTGIGIPSEFLPYVFDRFRQADAGTRRGYGGLGLGLAIVRHIAELHGGNVSAESAGENRGAIFRVVLPLRAARPDTMAEQIPPPEVLPPSRLPGATLKGCRVVVVDDEADARELFASILEGSGASVSTAASANEALDLLGRNTAHVLLSDVEMPHVDGYELLRRVRLDPRISSRLIAVAVSAHTRPEDMRRSLEQGFAAHITKPIEPAELVATLASLVQSLDVRG